MVSLGLVREGLGGTAGRARQEKKEMQIVGAGVIGHAVADDMAAHLDTARPAPPVIGAVPRRQGHGLEQPGRAVRPPPNGLPQSEDGRVEGELKPDGHLPAGGAAGLLHASGLRQGGAQGLFAEHMAAVGQGLAGLLRMEVDGGGDAEEIRRLLPIKGVQRRVDRNMAGAQLPEIGAGGGIGIDAARQGQAMALPFLQKGFSVDLAIAADARQGHCPNGWHGLRLLSSAYEISIARRGAAGLRDFRKRFAFIMKLAAFFVTVKF